MNTVYVLSLGVAYEGSTILSLHATEAGAQGALNRYIVDHPNAARWKLTGERMWKSGSNFLLIEELPVEG